MRPDHLRWDDHIAELYDEKLRLKIFLCGVLVDGDEIGELMDDRDYENVIEQLIAEAWGLA